MQHTLDVNDTTSSFIAERIVFPCPFNSDAID